MTPDEDRELVGLLKSYGRLETMVARAEERLNGTEADVTEIRGEFRAAVREVKAEVRSVGLACEKKITGLEQHIAKTAKVEREDREKRKASSRTVVVAVILASATVFASIIAAAAAIVTGGGP